MKRPAPLNELMNVLFSGPLENRLEEGKIWQTWDAAVGDRVAARAHPVSFRDGVLTVAVANAPWMQQLTFLKDAMVQKINQRIGRELVRDIHLKAGSIQPHRHTSLVHQPKERPLCDQEKLRIAEQSSVVKDPELREALTTLFGRYLANTPA